MTIDRTNFNLLVDDDGSNTVGTVWDKAHIKDVILDPVDAALGPPWVAPSFVAGNFTSDSGSWVVDAADVLTYAYSLQGKTLTVAWALNATTVTGAPTLLQITIPAGLVAVRLIVGICWAQDNNGVGVATYCQVAGGGTKIVVFKDPGITNPWTASTNGTGTRGSLTFEVY